MAKRTKKAPVKAEETPVASQPAERFEVNADYNQVINEGGIAVELPKEDLQVDHVPTEKEELPLKDKVLISDEDLPKEDTVPHITIDPEEFDVNNLYKEDIEVVQPDSPKPKGDLEWVTDPALLRKVEGYRDTLNGTLYQGVRR